MGVPKLTKPIKHKEEIETPIRGRPRVRYYDNWTKYGAKRPKYTPDTFHNEKNQCDVCDGTHFYHQKQLPPLQKHYRTYGYQTRRVQWRIRCANPKCSEPYGVILKPEAWDSVDS